MNPLLFLCAAAAPGDGTWTEQQVTVAAIERAPAVMAARLQLEAARLRKEQAQTLLLPRTRLGARYTRLSPIDNDPLVPLSLDLDAARAGAAQIVDPAARAVLGAQLEELAGLGGARIIIPENQFALSAELSHSASRVLLEILPAIEARGLEGEAARLQLEVTVADVALSAVDAFHLQVRAEASAQVATRAVEEAKVAAEAAEARLAAEAGTRPDVLRLEARLAEAQRRRAERLADLASAAASLRTLLGLETGPPLALATTPEAPIPEISDPVGVAFAARKELETLDRLVDAAWAGARAQQGAAWPDVGAAARLDHANPNNLFVPPGDRFRTSWAISAVVEWSPDRTVSALKAAEAARAEARALEAARDGLRDRIRLEVLSAEARYQAGQLSLEAAARAAAAAEAGLEATDRGYRLGVADVTALLTAQIALEEAQLAQVDAAAGLAVRRARWKRALGDPLAATR